MKKSITNSWLKKYAEGGPDDGFTPGPIVTPINEKPNLFFPIFKNPSTNEAQSDFDYEDYYSKADKYLSRPTFKGTSLNAKDIADAAQDFYNKNKYVYPLDLLLTQGQMETKLGKTLKSKNNFFNVGNTDSGAIRNFASPKDSVFNYMDLMYNDYLLKGKKKPEDLLKPKGFVNYAGKRYASASDYEKQLANQRSFIQKHISKKNGGDISIPDLTPNKWIMKYDEGGPSDVKCGPGQIKFQNQDGSIECISINSPRYKELYDKGIGYFSKLDKTSNKWVGTNQDDPDAVYITNKSTQPEVRIEAKFTPEQREAYRARKRAQQEAYEKQMKDLTSNLNNVTGPMSAESTRVDSIDMLKSERERDDNKVAQFKKENPWAKNLTDVDILERVNMNNSAIKNSRGMQMRGITQQEMENPSTAVTPSWFEGRKFEGRANEAAREKKQEWETTVDEENRAKQALDNNAEFVFPNGMRKKFKDMDKSEKSYVYSKARIRPAGSITDPTDYYSWRNRLEEFNPFSTATGWIGNFAEAPEMTEESNSILPWVGAVADPVLTVLPYLLANPELSTSQVLTKKMFNPVKPIQDVSKFMGAVEQGKMASYFEKKAIDKIRKNIAGDINQGIKEAPTIAMQEPANTPPNVLPAGMIVNKYGGSTKWINKYKNL